MRYYYKDNNNNYYSFKSEHFIKLKTITKYKTITDENGNEHTITYNVQKRDGLLDGYTQITEQEYNEHLEPLSNVVIDYSSIQAKRDAETEINECKLELNHLDIKRYKWLEGEISDNDFNTLYLPRIRELRARINELEEQLGQSN